MDFILAETLSALCFPGAVLFSFVLVRWFPGFLVSAIGKGVPPALRKRDREQRRTAQKARLKSTRKIQKFVFEQEKKRSEANQAIARSIANG
ncbi:MAG: hypothetical protein OXB89_01755 [Anaerolineaceae bacterium]|nr:hypothetical protein [Anaerolineaceae bacterium]